ncbi:MAG: hypothetical protein F4Y39_10085 [Gemmatimonadetes bacterium]|nr:hypothetical protein [Gemmatimonadota bacterium]MYK53757.1 hypothetical protein [Gemmatimonadota bacterium]
MNNPEEVEFQFSTQKFEEEWVGKALKNFQEDGWFSGVLYRVKGGKEAQVYCCKASPGMGVDLIAAKIYRLRRNRAMKNYAQYQQGRHITSDKRYLRALKKKTRTGKAVEDRAWLKHEFRTMQMLYHAGADVPQPFELSGNTILMEFIGNARVAAPLLREVRLDPTEAKPLFDRCIENIEIFLSCDSIHGDLSAFNILYWNGAITVIDFPQAVDPFDNPSAFSLLVRDVERVCQYFSRYGIQSRPVDIAADLWRRYLQREL